jgi:tetratricopeptide (TPR) repeat protein
LNLAYAFRIAGDTSAALERAQRAVELNPELPSANLLLADIYRSRSDLGNAEGVLTRALGLAAGNPHALAILASAYARLGRRADSLRLFHELEQLSAHRYVSPYDMGNVALMLGDEDRAVTLFEEAYRQRSSGLIFLRQDKADIVMNSPRLRSLIGKIRTG